MPVTVNYLRPIHNYRQLHWGEDGSYFSDCGKFMSAPVMGISPQPLDFITCRETHDHLSVPISLG